MAKKMETFRNPQRKMVFILAFLQLATGQQMDEFIRYEYRFNKVFANCSENPASDLVGETQFQNYNLTSVDFANCKFAPESWNLLNTTFENVAHFHFSLSPCYGRDVG
jgi:hypothetical protein